MAKLGNPITLTWVLSAAAILGFLAFQTLSRFSVDPVREVQQPDAPETELADQLPDFTLAQLGGDEANLHSWLGRPLVINFWATWCAPCLREIPLLVAFQAQQQSAAKGIQVIGIAVDRRDAVDKFAATTEFNYPNLVGESDAMEAAAAFGAEFFALPFTVFADATGRLLAVHTGEIHQGDLDNFAAVIADMNVGQSSVAQARERLAGSL